MKLDQLTVGAWMRVTEPVGYTDEAFQDWQQIAWLPPRDTWGTTITVGFEGGAGKLRLDWPHERIQIAPDPSNV